MFLLKLSVERLGILSEMRPALIYANLIQLFVFPCSVFSSGEMREALGLFVC